MPKQKAKDIYERIKDYVEQYAREYYSGNEEQGFRYWAFSELFLEYDLSDTEIIQNTLIDGPDDLGVDGYYIEDSEEQKTIHLFQSKHLAPGTTVGSSVLDEFRNAPKKLLNPELVAACRNEETRALHDFLAKLIPQGYSLRLVWVTSGTLSAQAKRYAESIASDKFPAQIGPKEFEVSVDFKALDLRDLVTLFQNHLEGEEILEPVVKLTIDPNRCHEVPGDFKSVQLTVKARDIIDIFDEHRYKILRLNPRGPLGNKTNREIKESLSDPIRRRMFHLLNNGISAICDAYTLKGNTITVRNFQIVNGCQTTITLWDVRAVVQNDPSVLVNLKLIECPQHLHRFIAKTTNTQAPLRAEDFIATEPIQIELQKQFEALPKHWFYEIKRGEWTRMTKRLDKERYREPDGSFRKLKSKDVAQAAVSFLGFPGEAKDKIRMFFGGKLSSDTFGDLSYSDVFNDRITAIQLLLPSTLHRRINRAVDRDKEDPDLKPSGVVDWIEYARLHLLWFIGEIIRGAGSRQQREIPAREWSQVLIDTVDDWYEGLYLVARAAMQNSVDDAKEKQTYRGHREFFRSSGNYNSILGKLPNALGLARSLGLDPLARLPRFPRN